MRDSREDRPASGPGLIVQQALPDPRAVASLQTGHWRIHPRRLPEHRAPDRPRAPKQAVQLEEVDRPLQADPPPEADLLEAGVTRPAMPRQRTPHQRMAGENTTSSDYYRGSLLPRQQFQFFRSPRPVLAQQTR